MQQPPDVWLGGRAPGELRRVGRLADGWLPSFSTPAIVRRGSRGGRRPRRPTPVATIDPEHWGVLVPYAHGIRCPPQVAQLVEQRLPGVDVSEVVAIGLDSLRRLLEGFVAVGFSKLVTVPFEEPDDWEAELKALADAVLDLQN